MIIGGSLWCVLLVPELALPCPYIYLHMLLINVFVQYFVNAGGNFGDSWQKVGSKQIKA